MEQILLAYGLPKETVSIIIMLYKNMKAMVCSPDGKTDFLNIVAEILQGDTSVPYLFIICQEYVLQTSTDLIKENSFMLKKARCRQYPAETIVDADYTDNIAFLANTLDEAKSLLHSLEQAGVGVGIHMNANKTEYMCFKQEKAIFTLSSKHLKLVDKFGTSVSSTESDVNIHVAKAWIAIDRLPIIWKSDLFYKIKQNFF